MPHGFRFGHTPANGVRTYREFLKLPPLLVEPLREELELLLDADVPLREDELDELPDEVLRTDVPVVRDVLNEPLADDVPELVRRVDVPLVVEVEPVRCERNEPLVVDVPVCRLDDDEPVPEVVVVRLFPNEPCCRELLPEDCDPEPFTVTRVELFAPARLPFSLPLSQSVRIP